jgi:acylphosphatase
MERRSVRVRIEGRVQGVGYRAWVERTAVGMGLDGWVRNRRDGGVEAVFAGSRADVDSVLASCHQGPRAAEVSMVKVLDELGDVPHGFRILPTA